MFNFGVIECQGRLRCSSDGTATLLVMKVVVVLATLLFLLQLTCYSMTGTLVESRQICMCMVLYRTRTFGWLMIGAVCNWLCAIVQWMDDHR